MSEWNVFAGNSKGKRSQEWESLMSDIVVSLSRNVDDFHTEDTIEKIRALISSDFRKPMYSYLSNVIFNREFINEDENDAPSMNIINNCQILFEYVFSENVKKEINDIKEIKDFVIRIYDDINLANLQNQAIIDNLKNNTDDIVAKAETEVRDEIKNMRTTYISAFAVLASILFGLVGGIAFSFEGIKQGTTTNNIHEFLSVVSLIGGIFLIVLGTLIWLIAWIDDSKSKKYIIALPLISAFVLFGLCYCFSQHSTNEQKQQSETIAYETSINNDTATSSKVYTLQIQETIN